jgi:hypothetical protein
VRKPGAFANYQYREQLYPQPIFRQAYDQLSAAMPADGHKHYLKILHMAKCYGEQKVASLLELCHKVHALPTAELISCQLQKPEKLPTIVVNIKAPDLATYDNLHNFGGLPC